MSDITALKNVLNNKELKINEEEFTLLVLILSLINLLYGGILLVIMDHSKIPPATVFALAMLIFGIVFVSAATVALMLFFKITNIVLEPQE